MDEAAPGAARDAAAAGPLAAFGARAAAAPRIPRAGSERADLVCALEGAAEFEHAVLLQYVFAAASLKRRSDEGVSELELEQIRAWEGTLLLIAREEMAHLAAVSNLLIAVGSTPWLVRPGLAGGRLVGPQTDALVLERFGEPSLARFVGLERAESGEETISGHYGAIQREIGRLDAHGCQVVCAPAVDRVDGWGISGNARFPPVTDAASALEVIDAIVGQGAGGEADDADSHLARLLAIEVELGASGFDPARRVAANPVLGAGAGTPIGDPFTAAVAGAFAAAYQAMVLLLELYYTLVEAEAGSAFGVRRAAQGMMGGVLRPLGEVLSELPVGEAAPGSVCGPAFTWDRRVALGGDRGESFATLYALLAGAGASLASLSRESGLRRLAFVGENLHLAGRLVAEAAAGDG